MNGKEIITSVIVPLLSALLGGLLALWGVRIAIRHEKKLNQEEYRRSLKTNAKPLLMNQGFFSGNATEPTAQLMFTESGKVESASKGKLTGVFKSADCGIIIFKKIQSGEVTYFPVTGEMSMVDKNTLINIEIVMADKKEKLQEMKLFVSDIYGNTYYYSMEYNKAEYKTSQLVLTSMSEPETTG